MIDNLIDAIDYFSPEADYLEIRYHKRVKNSILVKNGMATVSSGKLEGIFVRALIANVWGNYSIDSLDRQSIFHAIEMAIRSAESSIGLKHKAVRLADIDIYEDVVRPNIEIDPLDIHIEDKVSRIREIDSRLHDYNSKIVSSSTNYFDVNDTKFILTSEGTQLELYDTKVSLFMSAVAKDGAETSIASSRVAQTGGYERLNDNVVDELIKTVGDRAVNLLGAPMPPSGLATVILGPQLVRLLAHEALGHTVEADIVEAGSALRYKINQQIAPSFLNFIDDKIGYPYDYGTLPGYDDEGVRVGTTYIIRNGILESFLHNRESAADFGVQPTGNARAQDHRFEPIIRMTNSVIFPSHGEGWSANEIIEDTREGYLLLGRNMGQADSTTEFMFGVGEIWEIKNGEKVRPFKGVTISGIAIDVLQQIDALSREIKRGFAGHCGKGQIAFTGGGGSFARTKVLIGGK